MGSSAMQIHLKHLVRDRDRHGTDRYYVRVPGAPKVRVRAALGTDAFLAEYRAALAAIEAGTPPVDPRRRPRLPKPKTNTFRWLCSQYLDSADFRQLADGTRAVQRGILDHCCREPISPGNPLTFADFPLDRMTAKAILVLRDRKADRPGAATNRVKVLRRLFSWAADPAVGHVATNIARDIKRLRSRNPGGFRPWTVEDVIAYRKRHPIGSKARLAMELLLLTAQRRSDVVRLGRQHIVRGGFLRFTQAKRAGIDPVTLTLPIHPELQAALDLLPRDSLTFLMTGHGKPFTSNGFGNWFRDRCDEADLPHCSAHGLRKASSQLLAEGGATDREIMAVTGHKTSSEVDRYTRAARQRRLAKSAMAKLSLEPEEENEN